MKGVPTCCRHSKDYLDSYIKRCDLCSYVEVLVGKSWARVDSVAKKMEDVPCEHKWEYTWHGYLKVRYCPKCTRVEVWIPDEGWMAARKGWVGKKRHVHHYVSFELGGGLKKICVPAGGYKGCGQVMAKYGFATVTSAYCWWEVVHPSCVVFEEDIEDPDAWKKFLDRYGVTITKIEFQKSDIALLVAAVALFTLIPIAVIFNAPIAAAIIALMFIAVTLLFIREAGKHKVTYGGGDRK